MMPVPVLKLSLREQIVEQLRNDVLCGRLSVGDRLNEADLAKQFGVSRTPIREALQQLTYEGLLDGRHNAGVTVASMPPDSIREFVVPIRRSVETFALRSVFDSLTEADFRQWENVLDKMRQACIDRDYPSIGEQDIAFHRLLIRRAGLSDVEAIWNTLVSRVRHHFSETHQRDYADPVKIYEEHADIIEVFRRGKLEDAVRALEKNIA
ncbi:GntR family transcriptional regulator [Planctomicrobium sp. SH661]|uniref:GntR family transcriptional regulator n=1 Tax=Planctomicrobium sp. SH661 TaxID=3448124 RepID=UPI003F5C940B